MKLKAGILLFYILGFTLSTLNVFAQYAEKKKDFQCNNSQSYAAYDLLRTTRSYGNYEPEKEWSQSLTTANLIRKSVELEGGRLYTILLVTQNNVEASAIEIRDQYGLQLEYVYKVSELDKNQINLFYTPDVDGIYQIYFRVVTPASSSACTYMAVLKGDMDPEFATEKEDKDEE